MQEFSIDSERSVGGYRFRLLAQSVGKTPSFGLGGAGGCSGFGGALTDWYFLVIVIPKGRMNCMQKLQYSTFYWR